FPHPHIALLHYFFLLTIPPPPTSTLFPYTTLFRSRNASRAAGSAGIPERRVQAGDARVTSNATGNAARRSATFTLPFTWWISPRSEEHTSELQSRSDLVCRLLLEKKKKNNNDNNKN